VPGFLFFRLLKACFHKGGKNKKPGSAEAENGFWVVGAPETDQRS
jgi:hypothetical protein